MGDVDKNRLLNNGKILEIPAASHFFVGRKNVKQSGGDKFGQITYVLFAP